MKRENGYYWFRYADQAGDELRIAKWSNEAGGWMICGSKETDYLIVDEDEVVVVEGPLKPPKVDR